MARKVQIRSLQEHHFPIVIDVPGEHIQIITILTINELERYKPFFQQVFGDKECKSDEEDKKRWQKAEVFACGSNKKAKVP